MFSLVFVFVFLSLLRFLCFLLQFFSFFSVYLGTIYMINNSLIIIGP